MATTPKKPNTTTDKPTRQPPRPKSVTEGTTVTSASSWKQSSQVGTPLVVPSGNTCLVRGPGLAVFVRQGLIPNSLMPIIQEAMTTGKPIELGGAETLDTGMLQDMMDLMDAVTVYCVVEPKVHEVPYIDDGDGDLEMVAIENRDPDLLYVDEVDFNDKVFIFQYAVGGTADVEKFREEFSQHLGSLPAG